MVIFVFLEEGLDLGEIFVILGLLFEDNIWLRVGVRCGLKRGNGFNFVEFVDGEVGGDNVEVEFLVIVFRFLLFFFCKDGVKLEVVYRFFIDCEFFKEIEVVLIEVFFFECFFEIFLSLKDNKLFYFIFLFVEVVFLKERI